MATREKGDWLGAEYRKSREKRLAATCLSPFQQAARGHNHGHPNKRQRLRRFSAVLEHLYRRSGSPGGLGTLGIVADELLDLRADYHSRYRFGGMARQLAGPRCTPIGGWFRRGS